MTVDWGKALKLIGRKYFECHGLNQKCFWTQTDSLPFSTVLLFVLLIVKLRLCILVQAKSLVYQWQVLREQKMGPVHCGLWASWSQTKGQSGWITRKHQDAWGLLLLGKNNICGPPQTMSLSYDASLLYILTSGAGLGPPGLNPTCKSAL